VHLCIWAESLRLPTLGARTRRSRLRRLLESRRGHLLFDLGLKGSISDIARERTRIEWANCPEDFGKIS